MPSYDERTPSGWPLPFKSNTLEFDVERLRESFLAVDEALQVLRENFRELLDDKYYGLEERQYILDARMDVIAGQTTDDSEILDARVDAKGVTHPNVGHNVRELHNAVIDLAHAVEQDIQDLGAVLKQLDDLAHANIQGSLNAQAAHRQIHECIDAEILTRKESDEALQRQAQALSEASIQQSLSLRHEAVQRRKDIQQANARIDDEEQARSDSDSAIREALRQEKSARTAKDEALQKQVDTLNEYDTFLQSQAENLADDDSALQKQADSLAQASVHTSLTVQGLSSQQRAETQQRISADASLKTQADELSAASIQQSLNLEREAQQRRKDTESQHTGLLHESLSRSEHDDYLQSQINDIAFAVIQVALNDRETRERFRQSIDDFYQVMADSGNMTYMGAKVASGNEISEMLSDILSGSDSGAVSISEIPEELRNRVASSSEISEMLAEIFHNNN